MKLFGSSSKKKVKMNQIEEPDRYLDSDEFRYIMWIYEVFRATAEVPGHIVEIGVARGRNAVIFGHLIKMSGSDATQRYYGFDTFSGFVERDLHDNNWLKASSHKDTSKEFVEERLRKQKLNCVSHLIEGDIFETAQAFIQAGGDRFQPGQLKVSLLYIDCNAYEPAKFSMNIFKPHLSDGAVICIDEKMQGGETKALSEFCEENELPFKRGLGPFGVPAYTTWRSYPGSGINA